MTESTTVAQRWVAFGAGGAVGSIHRTADGFHVKLIDDAETEERTLEREERERKGE